MKSIEHRYDFALLFDVSNGNPNGDPDSGNSPRIDPETCHGLVSDVCLKRKIRNYISLAMTNSETGMPDIGYDIYVKEKAVLNHQHQRAYESQWVKEKDKNEKIPSAREWMCRTFFDVRMFGAVMTTGVNCGQVRGPVQLAFARSIDPITSLEQSIIRMAVTSEKEAKSQNGINRTMGHKNIVPYALYEVHGFISPNLAMDTGFNNADLDLLWQALIYMFDIDRSAARGEMASRKLVVFEHMSKLGNYPAHRLFDRIRINLKDSSRPPRTFLDYKVFIDKEDLPKGITIHEML